MMGHQRDIMAALGIDIWIPKGTACQPHQPEIWRDRAVHEPISEIILQQASAVFEAAVPENRSAESAIAAQDVLADYMDVAAEPKAAVNPVPVQELHIPALEISAFSIEAICLPQCVLIMDATAVTADQQLLWRNIQRAVSAEFFNLQWPFAWQNMQDGRGAGSYVQGFLDAVAVNKNILCLGNILHLQSSQSIQLASLQEMLDQPLLKKRLWQFMQNKIKE